MYPLFETIKVERGVPLNLKWHQARVRASYNQFYNLNDAPVLDELIRVPEEYRTGVVKCRFFYDRSGYQLDFSSYRPRKIASLKLVNGDHIDYSLKFTDRSALDQLLNFRQKCDEVLIVKNNKITDTTFTNIVLFDGKHWHTPKAPLLKGTCRNRLINEGRIFEADIKAEDLFHYASFKLINAMLDFELMHEIPIKQIK